MVLFAADRLTQLIYHWAKSSVRTNNCSLIVALTAAAAVAAAFALFERTRSSARMRAHKEEREKFAHKREN